MDSADRLLTYPYIVVRVRCSRCQRRGSYRLARLAERFGADIAMPELLERITADCASRNPRHPYHAGCEAYFYDLSPPRPPPDLPPAVQALKVVQGGKR